MNVKKIITAVLGIAIAFTALAVTVNFLSKIPKEIVNSTDAVFISNPEKQTGIVNPGGLISEKGSLQFGDLALFQLTNDETALEFVSANFDEKSEMITSARGRVNSGSVLAVNLLFGNELTLLDDRLAVTSRGGSFIFEKGASDESDLKISSTSVRVLSGSAKITFLDAANTEIFEGALIAGEEIKFTDKAIAEIFAEEDSIARVNSWKMKVETFSSKFKGEGDLVNKILEKLPRGKPNILVIGFNFIKEKILLAPEAQKKFYIQQFAGVLGEIAAGNTEEIDKFLATSDAEKRTQLQKAVALATPFTRLFISKSLLPSAKEKIINLAAVSAPLANFADIPELANTTNLNRNLIFIADDSENTNYAQNFLATARNEVKEADAETTKLLLTILQRDAAVINSDWLEAWAVVNHARIITDLDLAKAIMDQLSLAKFLVESRRAELAGSALKELVGLLSRGNVKFSKSSMEKIALEGNGLKNRILFLASLSKDMEFDEDIYHAWLEKREQLKTETKQVEIVETEEEPSPSETIEEIEKIYSDPLTETSEKVTRPQSEFEKFINLLELEEILPTSPTQTAEEEMMLIPEEEIPSFDQVSDLSDLIEEQLLVEVEEIFENSKDTFLAMGEEFTLLIADKNLDDEQEVSSLIESTEFAQLISKYMTEDSVEEYESMPDISKSMFFMFGLVLVLPDSDSDIEEIITDDIAILNYTKDGGTFGNETTSTDVVTECSVKMILENGEWKWERSPFTSDNVICTAS